MGIAVLPGMHFGSDLTLPLPAISFGASREQRLVRLHFLTSPRFLLTRLSDFSGHVQ